MCAPTVPLSQEITPQLNQETPQLFGLQRRVNTLFFVWYLGALGKNFESAYHVAFSWIHGILHRDHAWPKGLPHSHQ